MTHELPLYMSSLSMRFSPSLYSDRITYVTRTWRLGHNLFHYNDVIMSAMASQITSVMIAYSTVCSGADQRKHQSPASLAFVRGIHRWPVNSPHKGPVTRKMFPFDDVIMFLSKINPWQNITHTFLLSSSTVFMFSIQTASTGPSNKIHLRSSLGLEANSRKVLARTPENSPWFVQNSYEPSLNPCPNRTTF